MLYTTYFAKLKSLPKSITPIAISRNIPYWFKGEAYQKLAPSRKLLMMYRVTKDEDAYKAEFNPYLKSLDVAEVVTELRELAKCEDVALVCYEAPDVFCHRQLVSEWLNANGVLCEEWKNKDGAEGN